MATNANVIPAAQDIHATRLNTLRKRWLSIHLYLGLVAGAVLSILGLTGSILAFYAEVDNWLYADLKQISQPMPDMAYRPFPELMAAIRSAIPAEGKLSLMYFPDQSQRELAVEYIKTIPSKGDETHNLIIDPYTAQVVGTRKFYGTSPLEHSLIGFIWKLHYALLLPADVAMWVVGGFGLFLIVSVATGLYLWWPRNPNWKQAFAFKRNASSERRIYDIHKTIGSSSAVVLLVIFLTGILLVFPPMNLLVDWFSPVQIVKLFNRPKITSSPTVTLEQAVTLVEQRYPEGTLASVAIDNDMGIFVISKHSIPDLGWIDQRYIAVDTHSGEIVATLDTQSGSAGDVLTLWALPLHSGHVFGLPGRILVSLTGLLCPVLYATGVIRWLQKRRTLKLRSSG